MVQRTPEEIQTEIDNLNVLITTTITTNGNNEITGLDVRTLETAVSQLSEDIKDSFVDNTTTDDGDIVVDKLEALTDNDRLNVSAVDGAAIVNTTSGRIPVNVDGVFVDSAIRQDPTEIVTTLPIRTTTSSLFLGQGYSLENNGGFGTSVDHVTGDKFILLGRRFTETDGTDAGILATALGDPQEGVFQPEVGEERTITGSERISFVFTQQQDAWNLWHRFRGTAGLLTFDLFVARDPADDALSDQDLINLDLEDKIQLVDGLTGFSRRSGTGNANYWDFDDPNGEGGNAENDQVWYKSAPDFPMGRKLVIEWYNPTGGTTTVRGGIPSGSALFAPYFETGFESRTSEVIYPNDDTLTTATNTWSASKIRAEIDAAAVPTVWDDPVLDFDVNDPPASPSTGDRYIVGTSPTGVWVGQERDIAEWNGTAWEFTDPDTGHTVWDRGATTEHPDGVQRTYTGTTWVITNVGSGAGLGRGYIALNAGRESIGFNWEVVGYIEINSTTQELGANASARWILNTGANTTVDVRATYAGTDAAHLGEIYYMGSQTESTFGEYNLTIPRTVTAIPNETNFRMEVQVRRTAGGTANLYGTAFNYTQR